MGRYRTPEAEARAAESRRRTTAARNKAAVRLREAHWDEYTRLYREALVEMSSTGVDEVAVKGAECQP